MCYVRTTTEKSAKTTVIFYLCLGNRMIIDRGVVVFEKLRFEKSSPSTLKRKAGVVK